MNSDITPVSQVVVASPDDLSLAGMIADQVASDYAHTRYQEGIRATTSRRQRDDLAVFCRFLASFNVERTPDQLMTHLEAWRGVTAGLLESFLLWQGQQGYAVGSMNVHLATVKAYCKLARKAGVFTQEQLGALLLVAGYSNKAGRNLDEKREVTRIGNKKGASTSLNAGHAAQLKVQPDTLTGRRDAFMMCLLLDLGLRCGEIAGLTKAHFNLADGTLTFYREKVHLTQKHRLTSDTLVALMRYLPDVARSPLLFPGYKGKPLTTRTINRRIGELGEQVGLSTLSPHDCRHYWATAAIEHGTDIKALQTAGGWKSPAMPLRYAQAAEIANEGVKLG